MAIQREREYLGGVLVELLVQVVHGLVVAA